MKTIVLDFSECKYIGEIHKILKDGFDFPNYYGENLSALWDCLRYYDFDEDIKISVVGTSKTPKELHEYIGKMLNIFSRVHTEEPNIIFEIIS